MQLNTPRFFVSSRNPVNIRIPPQSYIYIRIYLQIWTICVNLNQQVNLYKSYVGP